jgi:hypothetical protein
MSTRQYIRNLAYSIPKRSIILLYSKYLTTQKMKKQIKNLTVLVALFIAASNLIGCTKKDSTSTPTPTTTTGKFTCKLGDENFSSPDAYIMPAFGGTIAVMAKDAKGRSFSLAIFEKDFPLNKTVEVAYSPSISYADEKSITYIAKAGTMTITAYGKNSSGAVTNIKGNFSVTLTQDGSDIRATEGVFDVSTK